MSAGYQQVTLAQLRTDLQSAMETVPYWAVSEATTALNEAFRVWNLLTGQWKTRKTQLTTAGVHWYSTPSGMLYPFRITHLSKPLTKTTWYDLDYNGRFSWEGQTTLTTGAPEKPTMWAPMGFNYYCIWPADGTGSRQLAIDGVAIAPQLTSDGEYVDLGREEHGAIISYALHKLAFKEGGPRFQASSRHFQRFIALAGNRNSRLRAATFYKPFMEGLDLSVSQKPQEISVTKPGDTANG